MSWFFRWWSLFPFFSVTDDGNYGYNTTGKISGMRFSLINFMFGAKTFYILTFIRRDGKIVFSAWHILRLDECQWNQTEESPFSQKNEHIKELSEKYFDHVKTISESESNIEKEFLLYLLDGVSQRKTLAYSKMSYYTTIVLVLLPLSPALLGALLELLLPDNPLIFKIFCTIIVLLVYMIFEWCVIALQYVSVSSVTKSSFRELKDTNLKAGKNCKLLCNYYYDWQEERFDANLRVGYIVTTELFVKYAIGLLLILLIIAGGTHLYNTRVITAAQQDEVSQLYHIDVSQLEDPFSSDSVLLSEIHIMLQKNIPSDVIIFVGEYTQALEIIHDNFDRYGDRIKEHIYIDSDLSLYIFKICLMED